MMVVEGLQQLESSITNEPLSGMHYEERMGRLSLENEYKRPRFSAVRDFPPNCGRFATSVGTSIGIGMENTATENHIPLKRVDSVRDYPPNCGIKISLVARALKEVKMSETGVEDDEEFHNNCKVNRVIPSLKPASHPSWWKGKVAHKSKPVGGMRERQIERPGSKPQLEISKDAWRTKVGSEIGGHTQKNNHPIARKTTVSGQASSSSNLHDINTHAIRKKVTETLGQFKAICRQLEYDKSKGKTSLRRVDFQAAKVLKKEGKYINSGKQFLGPVPGVEVGDEFHYRIELNIVGLHHPTQGGIDYATFGGEVLATSIVSSGGYADDLHNLHSLTYTGQGGNVMHPDKDPEDQKLERGNLALKNSMYAKTPVRMIRGFELPDGRTKRYIYDGLYLVVKYWKEMGPHGKLVFKFQLDRIEGQNLLQKK